MGLFLIKLLKFTIKIKTYGSNEGTEASWLSSISKNIKWGYQFKSWFGTITCIDRIDLPTNVECEINVSVFFELENSNIRAISFAQFRVIIK